jgi:hypothetical protein
VIEDLTQEIGYKPSRSFKGWRNGKRYVIFSYSLMLPQKILKKNVDLHTLSNYETLGYPKRIHNRRRTRHFKNGEKIPYLEGFPIINEN